MPTSPLWVVTCFAVVALALFAWRAFQIYRSREDEWGRLDAAGVERGLNLLLKRGYDGAFAILTDVQSGRFVQFRKYILRQGHVGLEMHFPRAPWSEPYYSTVQSILRRNDVQFERVGLQTEPTLEVIHADFGGNVALAARITLEIFVDGFRCPRLCVRMQADDICPVDETVDTSDHPRPVEMLAGRRPRIKSSTIH